MKNILVGLIFATALHSPLSFARLGDSEMLRVERRLSQIEREISLDLNKDSRALRAEQRSLEAKLELLKTEARVKNVMRQSPSPESFEPETDLARARANSPRFRGAGALAALGPVIELGTEGYAAVSAQLDQSIAEAIHQGRCPSWFGRNTQRLATALTAASLQERDQVVASCAAAGTPLDYESLVTGAKQDRVVGWAQVRCQNDGRIIVVHQNGTRSTISFSAPDRLAEISTRDAAAAEGSKSSVKMVRDREIDRFVVDDAKGEVLYNYPWKKGIAALTCATDPSGFCRGRPDQDSFHQTLVPAVDLTRASAPGFDGNVGRLGQTVYQLRGLVGLMPQSPSSFSGTCAALGGTLPKAGVEFAPREKAYGNRDDSPVKYEAARSAT